MAADPAIAIAEYARHIDRDYHPDLAGRPLRRRMYRLRMHLDPVLDLCIPDAWLALGGLKDAPSCFLDEAIARATARFVRAATPAVAMRVPSVAFLDDLTRWSLVVFLDKLPGDPRTYVTSVTDAGLIQIG